MASLHNGVYMLYAYKMASMLVSLFTRFANANENQHGSSNHGNDNNIINKTIVVIKIPAMKQNCLTISGQKLLYFG